MSEDFATLADCVGLVGGELGDEHRFAEGTVALARLRDRLAQAEALLRKSFDYVDASELPSAANLLPRIRAFLSGESTAGGGHE
jgi:hypothetical protein